MSVGTLDLDNKGKWEVLVVWDMCRRRISWSWKNESKPFKPDGIFSKLASTSASVKKRRGNGS